MVNQGVPQKIVMESVGQIESRMMMGVYIHKLLKIRETLRQVTNGRLYGQNLQSLKMPQDCPTEL